MIELGWLLKSAYLVAVNMGVVFILPTMVALCSFTSYTLILEKPLTAERAFASLSLFSLLIFPLFQLPQILVSLVTTKIAFTRIQSFLILEENSRKEQVEVEETQPAIEMKTPATFVWDRTADAAEGGADAKEDNRNGDGDGDGDGDGESKEQEPFQLKDIQLNVMPGELVAVIGGTGEGVRVQPGDGDGDGDE